jgi:hypothetical protein
MAIDALSYFIDDVLSACDLPASRRGLSRWPRNRSLLRKGHERDQ